MTKSPLAVVNDAWKTSGAFAVSLEGSRRSGCRVEASGPEGFGVAAAVVAVVGCAAGGGGVAGVEPELGLEEPPPMETGSSFLAHAVSASTPRKRWYAFKPA